MNYQTSQVNITEMDKAYGRLFNMAHHTGGVTSAWANTIGAPKTLNYLRCQMDRGQP